MRQYISVFTFWIWFNKVLKITHSSQPIQCHRVTSLRPTLLHFPLPLFNLYTFTLYTHVAVHMFKLKSYDRHIIKKMVANGVLEWSTQKLSKIKESTLKNFGINTFLSGYWKFALITSHDEFPATRWWSSSNHPSVVWALWLCWPQWVERIMTKLEQAIYILHRLNWKSSPRTAQWILG